MDTQHKYIVARTEAGRLLLLEQWQIRRGGLTCDGVQTHATVNGVTLPVTVEFKGDLSGALYFLNSHTIRDISELKITQTSSVHVEIQSDCEKLEKNVEAIENKRKTSPRQSCTNSFGTSTNATYSHDSVETSTSACLASHTINNHKEMDDPQVGAQNLRKLPGEAPPPSQSPPELPSVPGSGEDEVAADYLPEELVEQERETPIGSLANENWLCYYCGTDNSGDVSQCGSCFQIMEGVSIVDTCSRDHPHVPHQPIDDSAAVPEKPVAPLVTGSSIRKKVGSIPPRRKLVCPLCLKVVAKLPMHLTTVHKEHDEVAPWKELPVESPVRKEALKKLRLKGLALFNSRKTDDQPLMTASRRTEIPRFPCPYCQVLLAQSSLKRHSLMCPSRPQEVDQQVPPLQRVPQAKLDLIAMTGMLNTKKGPVMPHVKANDALKVILSKMRVDDAYGVILQDPYLLDYGNLLTKKYRTEAHLKSMVRRKLRCAAAVYAEMKRRSPETMKSFRDVFRTEDGGWDLFIESVNFLAGWNELDLTFRSPSLIREVDIDFNALATHMQGYGGINKDPELKADAANFFAAKRSRFFAELGKPATCVAAKKKWQKKQLLPLTEDIQKLDQHIKRTVGECVERLTNGYSEHHWVLLNKAVIANQIVFNRKRCGDVEKMEMHDFKNRSAIQKDTDVYNSLPPNFQVQSHKFVHITTQGKGIRGVAVMMTHDDVEHILLLHKYRPEARVFSNNCYVFGRDCGYFKAGPSLREMAENCGASNPTLLCGTKLRKHLASTLQALNMSDNELSLVADFLGHTDKTHRQFYRLPSDVAQLTVVSTLLGIVGEGKVPHLRGLTVSQISERLNDCDPDELERRLLAPENLYPLPSTSGASLSQVPCSSGATMPKSSSSCGQYDDDCTTSHDADSAVLPPSEFSSSDEDGPPRRKMKPTTSPIFTSRTSRGRRGRGARGGKVRNSWNTLEKRALRERFQDFITDKTDTLSRAEVGELKNSTSVYTHRTVSQMTGWVYAEKKRKLARK